MSILNLITEDESFNYISLKEAINLLAQKTDSSVFSVATYLLNKFAHTILDSHSRGLDHRILQTSYGDWDGYGWTGNNDAFSLLQFIAENENKHTPRSVTNDSKYNNISENTFWERKNFFNADFVKPLNLLNDKDPLLSKQCQYIWDDNYLALLQLDPPLDTDEDHFIDDFLFSYEGNCPTAPYFDEPIQQTIDGFNNEFKKASVLNEELIKINEQLLLKVGILEKELYQEQGQSFLLESSYQISQSEIDKLKNDIQKERHEAFELLLDATVADNENDQLKAEVARLEADLISEEAQFKLLSSNYAVHIQEIECLRQTINEKDDQLDALNQQIKNIAEQEPKSDSVPHPSLNPDHPNHAPELLLAIQAWDARYIKNEYPHHDHTPSITKILKNRDITQVNLVKRICAITNKKTIKSNI